MENQMELDNVLESIFEKIDGFPETL